MSSLFHELTQALSPEGVIPITDFRIIIKSRYEAAIFYDIGGETLSYDVDIKVEHTPGEPECGNNPGVPARAEIVEVIGLSIAERHEYDKWMAENDIEPELLKQF